MPVTWTENNFPPIDIQAENAYLSRSPGQDIFTIMFPNLDSYDLSPERARLYLSKLDVPDYERTLDYVWNFHGVLLNLTAGTFTWVPLEDIERISGGKIKEPLVLRSGA